MATAGRCPSSRLSRRLVELVETWAAGGGARVNQSNPASRILKPAAASAGVGEWVIDENGNRHPSKSVGFHTFRHTNATLLFRHGASAKQATLGQHRPPKSPETASPWSILFRLRTSLQFVQPDSWPEV